MAWITGERVWLRAWERDDLRLRWETEQTPDATEARLRNWHEPPRSLAQLEAEFEARDADDETVVALVIVADERVIGDINLFEIDRRNRSARLGLSIWRAEDRNRGYGGDAVAAMVRWGFRELNLHRIELTVDPANARAIHVYEKLGFVREGLRREAHYAEGRFGDDLLMGLLDREFEAHAQELRDERGSRAGARD